jgi:UDPglucose 6-dehydrogenase
MKTGRSSVSIIGLGYVGLCTAAAFAFRGIMTLGIDIDEERIRQIQKGKSPLHEPHLDEMLKKAVKKKLLDATSDISRAMDTNASFLTVGTPSQPDGSIDLTYVMKATVGLGNTLRKKLGYHLLAVKSTVIPGTTNNTVRPILEHSSGKTVGPSLGLCANPEFLKEGTAINDALYPDKIVIGSNDKKSADQLTRIYRRFYASKLPPLIFTSPETAELVKYASNAFLATKVSYINTIANIAQHLPGVDVNQVADAIGHDPRIGPLFLKAGPGYGGSCFHKDLQALISHSNERGYDPVLLRATEETNEAQADKVVDLSEKLVGHLEDKRIAILGLAFKKDTDDIREAASIRVIDRLRKKGAKIIAYDPMAMPGFQQVFGNTIELARNPHAALKGADCAIVMTEWDEFKRIKAKDYVGYMREPNLVDARRIYRPEKYGQLNLVGIGLGTSSESNSAADPRNN